MNIIGMKLKCFIMLALILLSAIACNNEKLLSDDEQQNGTVDIVCNQMNINIVAQQSLISALLDDDKVKSVETINQNGEDIGYKINFKKADSVFDGVGGFDCWSDIVFLVA